MIYDATRRVVVFRHPEHVVALVAYVQLHFFYVVGAFLTKFVLATVVNSLIVRTAQRKKKKR